MQGRSGPNRRCKMSLYSVDQNQSCVTFLVYARHNGVFNSTVLSHTHIHTQTVYTNKGDTHSRGTSTIRWIRLDNSSSRRSWLPVSMQRDWGTYYMRHIWQLPVDHSQPLFAPSNSHCANLPLDPLPISPISCLLYREWHWVKLAN